MKESNIVSVLNAYSSLSTDIFESYLELYSIKIKNEELDDLGILYNHIVKFTNQIELFDKYFIGYSIPQIGKEFDLLRFDAETIVNIELKRESDTTTVETQLKLNKYYLSFLKRETHLFSYISSSRKLYQLDEDDKLIECNIRQLIEKIATQNVVKLGDIDNLFNPSNYLVSPFNSTVEFIKGKYFLTTHQEKIKQAVLKEISTSNFSFFSIKGKSGTGKTLLTYDIVKEVQKRFKEVLIIHCGILNNGHTSLKETYAWNIIPPRSIINQDYSKFDLVIVDEAQRIRIGQLNHLIGVIKSNSKNCIFSYDRIQTLTSQETNSSSIDVIERSLTKAPFELTTKIRTNKEVARFIKCLFNNNEMIHPLNYSNVELQYFENHDLASKYLNQLKSENWKIINYTPDSRTTLPYEHNNLQGVSENAHTAIGQEFDNVVAIIDEYFCYNQNGGLSVSNYKREPFYLPTKMLFQIVSRTRIKLGLVIINNPQILKRCLNVLNKSTNK